MATTAPLDLADIGPGFGDPVAHAQAVFRLILDATAHPGRVVELPPEILQHNSSGPGGSGLGDAAAALALTLLDFETPVWLDDELAGAGDYLRFHCGAPITADPKASRFAFLSRPGGTPLAAFDLGDTDFPDRSTTLVIAVPSLASGEPGASGPGLTLRGPGIRDSGRLHVEAIAPEFWTARAELAPLFPLGLDLVLACGRSFAAIPRTTVVTGD